MTPLRTLFARCLVMFLMGLGVDISLVRADERPAHGLMWNRTGLPAVFPLLVKTNPGKDYYLVLSDADQQDPALAAYIEGGRFFKVLVPPGQFNIQLATGTNWQDETRLFGADQTILIQLPEPLTFAIRGYATKAGHIIDLTDRGGAVLVRDSFICQRYALVDGPEPLPPFRGRDQVPPELRPEMEIVDIPNTVAPPRIPDPDNRPAIPTDYAPYFSRPRFEVVHRLC